MPKQWSLIDFFLVMMGGFLGATVVAGLGPLLPTQEVRLVLLIAGQFTGQLLVVWLLARGKEEPDLGFEVEARDLAYLGAGMGLQLGLALLFYPLAVRLFPEGESPQQVVSILGTLQSTWAKVAAVVGAVVLAPVVEEIVFRGILLKALERRGRAAVMVVSSLLFAAVHLLDLDPDTILPGVALVLPQLFVVGMVLAWVTLRSGRLGPAIFLHSGFNLIGVMVLLLPADLVEAAG